MAKYSGRPAKYPIFLNISGALADFEKPAPDGKAKETEAAGEAAGGAALNPVCLLSTGKSYLLHYFSKTKTQIF